MSDSNLNIIAAIGNICLIALNFPGAFDGSVFSAAAIGFSTFGVLFHSLTAWNSE